MKRHHSRTGEEFVPHICKDGQFRIADPTLGRDKKLSKNQIAVPSERELLVYVRRGFHVRMRGADHGQINLIQPEEIDLG